AQERRLQVQGITRPRGERRRNREEGARRTLYQESRRRRVPCRVAARLEGRPQAARGEAGGVRLPLNQILPRELCDSAAAHIGGDERVVLLRGEPGEGLEPMG